MRSLCFKADSHRREGGFTLVEIMVAMVIGMLGIIIMMQMFSLFEGQKRSTTGASDTLNAASIAMYGMQQSLQQAGYCFAATAPTAGGVVLKPAMIDVATITNNGLRDINTNTLVVSFGNDACAPESASGVATAATMVIQAYAVRNGNLMQCDWLMFDCTVAANWVQIASNIVSMKAECVSGQGVRLALVARNPQIEKEQVTAAVPAWTSQGTNPINLTATAVDAGFTWQNYRYKVFETLAPIRNTIWKGGTGC